LTDIERDNNGYRLRQLPGPAVFNNSNEHEELIAPINEPIEGVLVSEEEARRAPTLTI
jgi:hypothetical protein